MERIPISVQGVELVIQELERLKKERPGIIQAIKEAREEGDISENAGYEAARERQGMLEARITYLESRLQKFNVLDLGELAPKTVAYSATVTMEDADSGEIKEYTLLGPDEMDYACKGAISVCSPVAGALLGREEGDEVVVDAPRGKITYEIIKIEYRPAQELFVEK